MYLGKSHFEDILRCSQGFAGEKGDFRRPPLIGVGGQRDELAKILFG